MLAISRRDMLDRLKHQSKIESPVSVRKVVSTIKYVMDDIRMIVLSCFKYCEFMIASPECIFEHAISPAHIKYGTSVSQLESGLLKPKVLIESQESSTQ
jgi:hypothetical protein